MTISKTKVKVEKKKTIKNPEKNKLSCAQKIINFSSIKHNYRFDKPNFDPIKLLDSLKYTSPKITALLSNIQKLDKKDFNDSGKLYKHYIYSGTGNGYGAKILASAFIAAGYINVTIKKGSRISIDHEIIKIKDESKFALLSSTAIWNTPTTQLTTKETLQVFNERPHNIYGDKIRFIILDSGFKEGIDLYDVKYCHIFEDQLNPSDLIQAQGRALRFRGQCGLEFNNGWVLNVFNYSLVKVTSKYYFLTDKKSILRTIQENDPKLKFKMNLIQSMTKIIKESAIDADLNKNVNNYKSDDFSKYIYFSVISLGLTSLLAYGILKK